MQTAHKHHEQDHEATNRWSLNWSSCEETALAILEGPHLADVGPRIVQFTVLNSIKLFKGHDGLVLDLEDCAPPASQTPEANCIQNGAVMQRRVTPNITPEALLFISGELIRLNLNPLIIVAKHNPTSNLTLPSSLGLHSELKKCASLPLQDAKCKPALSELNGLGLNGRSLSLVWELQKPKAGKGNSVKVEIEFTRHSGLLCFQRTVFIWPHNQTQRALENDTAFKTVRAKLLAPIFQQLYLAYPTQLLLCPLDGRLDEVCVQAATYARLQFGSADGACKCCGASNFTLSRPRDLWQLTVGSKVQSH